MANEFERTDLDQIKGLDLVREKLQAEGVICHIVRQEGDVISLCCPGSRAELVYVVGGFDLWIDGSLSKPDLSVEDAVKSLKYAIKRVTLQ